MTESATKPMFHIVDARVWGDADTVGEYRAASLASEGFIHCSYAEQVRATLKRHYPSVLGLIIVELDPTRIEAPIRVEDTSGSGAKFPHVYGPIPTRAAVSAHPVEQWLSDQGDLAGGASPDH
jgi:uncharacterized protein (DUF952 family)